MQCGAYWAGEGAPEPINARVEKVATSRYFRGAFAHHRCLVPANGWFEWTPVDGKKQPHFLSRGDGEPLWLAGIWSKRPDGKPGCAILTEPARGVAAQIHDRMPLALGAKEPLNNSSLGSLGERDLLRSASSARSGGDRLARFYLADDCQAAAAGFMQRFLSVPYDDR